MSAEDTNQQQQVAERGPTRNGQRQDPHPPTEIKHLYRLAYGICKELDEHRREARTIAELFAPDVEAQRCQLAKYADKLLFQSHALVARKAREILWRKVYYDQISAAKRLLASKIGAADIAFCRAALYELLTEAIATYKRIVLRLNRVYKLDLDHLVDLRLCKANGSNGSSKASSKTSSKSPSGDGGDSGDAKCSLELVSYGLETVHAALISLGDLHRYTIDLHYEYAVSREQAARFYCDAFVMNTKIGMPQNQMGTLYAGLNCELDAVYYYLFSLISATPFELSEPNVDKLFKANESDLQRMTRLSPDRHGIDFAMFMMRFKRVAQICFYDKQLDDELAILGHPMLLNLRALLRHSEHTEWSPELNADGIFKMVSIMLFGVHRLQELGSQTVHMLNALLVAVCSELIDCANANVTGMLDSRRDQVAAFANRYGVLYDTFEQTVRTNREALKRGIGEPVQILGHATNPIGRPKLPLPQQPATTSSSGSGSSTGAIKKTTAAAAAVASQPKAAAAAAVKPEAPAAKKKSGSRRRRPRFSSDSEESDADFGPTTSDEEEEDTTTSSGDDSDYELDSNFSSEEDDEELVTAYELKRQHSPCPVPSVEATTNAVAANGADGKSCGSDTSIEGEHFVYPNGTTAEPLESMMRQVLHVADAPAEQQPESASPAPPTPASPMPLDDQLVEDQLRYKRRYAKPDPTLMFEFARSSVTLRAIKILFDWLAANPQLLTNCHSTNPEFIDKIMELINSLNIDIFTRKVFFDAALFRVRDIRRDMERLFASRATIPLAEDRLLKDFAVVAEAQAKLDWEYPLREQLSANEEHVLRMSKLVDFGFVISKSKMFGWRFCARARRFLKESAEVKGGGGGGGGAQGRNGGGGGRSANGWERGAARGGHRNGRNGGGGGDGDYQNAAADEKKRARRRRKRAMKLARTRHAVGEFDDEFYDLPGASSATTNGDGHKSGKSYQRQRQRNGGAVKPPVTVAGNASAVDTEFPALSDTVGAVGAASAAAAADQQSKEQIMGKLWLRAEVSALEAQDAENQAIAETATWATPFLVIDALALTVSGGSLVKQLIRSKRFVVLVPTAVLGELDAMKKYSEAARIAIRWLDQEITRGNRFMRMQRSYETQSFSMLKLPKKMEREDCGFVQIAQFCNYMQASHGSEPGVSVVTLLTGDDLVSRQSPTSPPLSYTGIMGIVSVPFASIGSFHARFRNIK